MSIIVPDRSLEAPIDPRPFPLDERIRSGLEIYEGLRSEDLIVVADRFEQVLQEMREDDTKEYGACLAFAVGGLSKRHQLQLESYLVETGQRQNHGLMQAQLPRNRDTLRSAIWAGEEGKAKFTLFRSVGQIVLNTGEAPKGIVWSLHGTSREL